MPIDLRNIGSISPNGGGTITLPGTLDLTGTPAPEIKINGVPLATGGTPAGANQQIQYNNNGAFGASPGLTWNNAVETLTLTASNNSYSTLTLLGNIPSEFPFFGRIAFRRPSFSPNPFVTLQAACGAMGEVACEFLMQSDGGGLQGSVMQLKNPLAGQYALNLYGDVNLQPTAATPNPVYRINGVPVGGGGAAQTPWESDIDGANFYLNNVRSIGVGTTAPVFANSASIRLQNNSTSLYFNNNSGNIGSGFILGLIDWHNLSNAQTRVAQIAVSIALGEPTTSNRRGADMVFLTRGHDTAFAEQAMVLSSHQRMGIGQVITDPAYRLEVAGDVNLVGAGAVYRINGVPISDGGGGGSQTPWLSNIEGANFQLNNVQTLVIGTSNTTPNANLVIQNNRTWAIQIANSGATSGSGIRFDNNAPGGNGTFSFQTWGSTHSWGALYQGTLRIACNRDIWFSVNNSNTEAMRITTPDGWVGIKNNNPGYPLDVTGDVNISGTYRVNGTPITAGGGSQTPWTSNIDAANHTLSNVNAIGIGAASNITWPFLIWRNGFYNWAMMIQDTAAGSSVGLGLTNDVSAASNRWGLFIWGSTHSWGALYQNCMRIGSYRDIFFAVNNSNTEVMRITNAGNIGVGKNNPLFKFDVTGDVNITGTYRVNGTPVVGVPQTPWASDINGANFQLNNVNQLAIGATSTALPANSAGYPTNVIMEVGTRNQLPVPAPASIVIGPAGNAETVVVLGNLGSISYNNTHGRFLMGRNLFMGTGVGPPYIAPNGANGYQGIEFGSGNSIFFYAYQNDPPTSIPAGTSVTPPVVMAVVAPNATVPRGGLALGKQSATHLLSLQDDSAAKPATNTWTIVSDMRTKRKVNRFDGDIEVIRRLNPVVAEYNGRAGTPDGMRVVSFNPEELREIVPQCVSSTKEKLNPDDTEETEVLGINTHEIFFHMLRAVQQLDARLKELEKRR